MVIAKNESRTAVARVILVEGTNISRTRSNGNKFGIFCTLHIGRQKEDSEASYDAKHPVWNNEFEFYLFQDCSEVLEVDIKTFTGKNKKESFSNFEDVGKAKIDLSNLKPETIPDVWVDIIKEEDGGGGKKGKLHFQITITGITSFDSSFSAISDASNSRWDSLKISMEDKS